MKYSGKLYGKVGPRRYVELLMTSEEVDAMEKERDALRERVRELRAVLTKTAVQIRYLNDVRGEHVRTAQEVCAWRVCEKLPEIVSALANTEPKDA